MARAAGRPRNACSAAVVGDDVVGDPVRRPRTPVRCPRLSPISSETARISVTSSPATLSTPAPPSASSARRITRHDVVDVDRVHARTPIAVELDRLACLDPLDEPREHPSLLARPVRNEEAEDGDVRAAGRTPGRSAPPRPSSRSRSRCAASGDSSRQRPCFRGSVDRAGRRENEGARPERRACSSKRCVAATLTAKSASAPSGNGTFACARWTIASTSGRAGQSWAARSTTTGVAAGDPRAIVARGARPRARPCRGPGSGATRRSRSPR